MTKIFLCQISSFENCVLNCGYIQIYLIMYSKQYVEHTAFLLRVFFPFSILKIWLWATTYFPFGEERSLHAFDTHACIRYAHSCKQFTCITLRGFALGSTILNVGYVMWKVLSSYSMNITIENNLIILLIDIHCIQFTQRRKAVTQFTFQMFSFQDLNWVFPLRRSVNLLVFTRPAILDGIILKDRKSSDPNLFLIFVYF